MPLGEPLEQFAERAVSGELGVSELDVTVCSSRTPNVIVRLGPNEVSLGVALEPLDLLVPGGKTSFASGYETLFWSSRRTS